MDTMQICLILTVVWNLTKREEILLIDGINKIKSPSGFTFCDVLKIGKKGVILKISFPRFFYGNNAYLVKTSDEYFKVIAYFIKEVRKIEKLSNLNEIEINRIDIPFTYIMNSQMEFSSYSNIFVILAKVFTKKYDEVRPKAIIDLIKRKEETIVYSDRKDPSGYNKKITIYNQYENLKTKLSPSNLKIAKNDFPELKDRMRIEVSYRIRRNPMKINEFLKEDLFLKYSNKFKKFIESSLINRDNLKEVYAKEKIDLRKKLNEAYSKQRINYRDFIYKNINEIYDYEILRGALKEVKLSEKGFENAITRVRKILNDYEKEEEKIILKTRFIIRDIKRTIKNSFKKKKKSEWRNSPF